MNNCMADCNIRIVADRLPDTDQDIANSMNMAVDTASNIAVGSKTSAGTVSNFADSSTTAGTAQDIADSYIVGTADIDIGTCWLLKQNRTFLFRPGRHAADNNN